MKDSRRKGILLAGGTGSRLHPITLGVSKHLLPIYDKPMIYYPLSVLMLAGIREIAIITTPMDEGAYRRLLGDGSQWGLSITYLQQPNPEGLAQAYLLAEEFLNGGSSAMLLGDNLFFGHGLPELLAEADSNREGASVFAYQVADPARYGVIGFDPQGRPQSIFEKPKQAASNFAVCGIYFFDGTAPLRAAELLPSARGELEITSLIESYLKEDALSVIKLGRGFAWLDVGTHTSLLDAGNFVRTITERQGLMIGIPDEIAFRNGWISAGQLESRAARFSNSNYGRYIAQISSSG